MCIIEVVISFLEVFLNISMFNQFPYYQYLLSKFWFNISNILQYFEKSNH